MTKEYTVTIRVDVEQLESTVGEKHESEQHLAEMVGQEMQWVSQSGIQIVEIKEKI